MGASSQMVVKGMPAILSLNLLLCLWIVHSVFFLVMFIDPKIMVDPISMIKTLR